MTITTYYPSPYGSYKELRSQKMAIGFTYYDSASYPWDEGGVCFANEICNADLVVEGNVGIGTRSPGYPLHVRNTSTTDAKVKITDGGITTFIGSGRGYDNPIIAFGDNGGVVESNNITDVRYGFSIASVYNGDLNIGRKASSATWVDTFSITRASGNVGIGTTSPGAKLHIEDTQNAGTVAGFIENLGTTGNTHTAWSVRNNANNMLLMQIYGTSYVTSGPHFSDGTHLYTGAPGGMSIETRNDNANADIRFYTGAAMNQRMIIDNGGNVGIGTTGPAYPLHVKNNGTTNVIITAQGSAPTANSEQYIMLLNDDASQGIYLEVNGSTNTAPAGTRTYAPRLEVNGARGLGISAYQGPLKFWTGSSVNAMTMDTSGNVTGTYGNYHVSSDIRRKKDIVTIPNALEKVLSLRGVNFRWKDSKPDDNLHMGMIAQEVEKVVPEVVHTADDEMKTKAVEYQYVVGLLVEAVKAQQQEIELLKAEIANLKKKASSTS
jgi:hypothetical protein